MGNRQVSGEMAGAGAPLVPGGGYWISRPIHFREVPRGIARQRGYLHECATEPDTSARHREAARSQRGRIGRIPAPAGYLYPYEHEDPDQSRPAPPPAGFWRQLAYDAAWVLAAFAGLAVGAVALGAAL